jgi:hypothetical protein
LAKASNKTEHPSSFLQFLEDLDHHDEHHEEFCRERLDLNERQNVHHNFKYFENRTHRALNSWGVGKRVGGSGREVVETHQNSVSREKVVREQQKKI